MRHHGVYGTFLVHSIGFESKIEIVISYIHATSWLQLFYRNFNKNMKNAIRVYY